MMEIVLSLNFPVGKRGIDTLLRRVPTRTEHAYTWHFGQGVRPEVVFEDHSLPGNYEGLDP